MTNKELRKALLKKLGITPQALSQRVQKLKKRDPMTTEDATYVIAHKEGIILDRYLNKEVVDKIRELLQKSTPNNSPVSRLKSKRRTPQASSRTIIISREFKGTDPILSNEKLSEAKLMATIYPLLYVLENSIREVIELIMTKKFGPNWWESNAPKKIKETVSNRMAEENRDSWHQRRGARPIDYLDLKQLPYLMRKIQKDVFPNILSSIEWFTQLIEEVYKSRCVICHMNPLDNDNIQAVKLRLTQWQKQIKAKKAIITSDS